MNSRFIKPISQHQMIVNRVHYTALSIFAGMLIFLAGIIVEGRLGIIGWNERTHEIVCNGTTHYVPIDDLCAVVN